MAITIEGYSVVVKRERIQPLLDDRKLPPLNATVIADDDLWRCSFMKRGDAAEFVRSLESFGLNGSQGPNSDAVVVDESDRSMEPYCEWLLTAMWEKAVIAWLVGTEPLKLVARQGWDPKVGSGLTYRPKRDDMEIVGVEGMVEVFRDKNTGQKFYVGRTTTPVEGLFKTASDIIVKHWRMTGDAPVTGSEAEDVASAVEMLDQVLAAGTDTWRVHWLRGKARVALGDMSAAHESFARAYELEKDEEVVCRELGSVCLELGLCEQAVSMAERAVALHPDHHELLSNLALAYLLSGRLDAAEKTSQAALKVNSADPINNHVWRLIDEVVNGRRPQPVSMRDLQRKPLAKDRPPSDTGRKHSPQPDRPRRKFWQFWKR